MSALVVYESLFGNTEQVARAIGAGLAESMEVEVASAASTSPTLPPDLSLLVIGGPTHAFSMSRPSTREEAVKQGATTSPEVGLREWLAGLQSHAGTATVITFDTRVSGVRHLPGSAAKSAARHARRHGFADAQRGESFYVDGTAGPLLAGEIQRATDWGRQIASTVFPREQANRS